MNREPLGNVLVATDFSHNAHEALVRAAHLPIALGSALTLLHVVPHDLPADLRAQLRAAAGALLGAAQATAVSEVSRAGKEVAVFTAIDEGRPAECVVRRAIDERTELIVIGRGVRRTLGERLLGSDAERIVRASDTSVLVVGTPPGEPYRRPLLAVDLSTASTPSLELALRVCHSELRELDVLHAFDTPYLAMLREGGMTERDLGEYTAEAEGSARAQLEAWHASVADLGVALNPLLRRGDPRRVIVEEQERRQADLIVIGARRHSMVGRLLLGSVAEWAVRAARSDVLVVRTG
jgi:nucleotide-binding universal stress UspA family protein